MKQAQSRNFVGEIPNSCVLYFKKKINKNARVICARAFKKIYKNMQKEALIVTK